jgi:hypothetical protein
MRRRTSCQKAWDARPRASLSLFSVSSSRIISRISLDRDSRGELFAEDVSVELGICGDVKGGRIGLARSEKTSQVGCGLNNAPIRLISPYGSVTPNLCTCPSSGARTRHF